MANIISSVAAHESLDYEIFIKPLLDDPLITSLPFDFIVGKYLGKDLYFNTQLDKIAYKKVACGWTFGGDTTFTKKTIFPVEIAAAIEQCYQPLIDTVFAFGLPDGWERGTLSVEVKDYMRTQMGYAFNRDLITILFLGDEANGDPYYAIKDGIYKKLAAGVTAGDGTVDSGVTLNSTTLNETNFFSTMNQVWMARTRFMRGMDKSRLVWIWTESVYDAYLTYLEKTTQTTAGVMQFQNVTDGLIVDKFKGVKIVVVPLVDERLSADFSGSPASPASTVDPYRVILTDPTNHKVLLDADGFKKVNEWYENKDDKYYMTASALFEYEYGYGELNVIAGF